MAQVPKPPPVDAAKLRSDEASQGAQCSYVIVCGRVFEERTYTVDELRRVFRGWYASERRAVGIQWSWSGQEITLNPVHVNQLRFLSPLLESVPSRKGFLVHGIAPWGHAETQLRMGRLIGGLRPAFRQDYVELWVGRRWTIVGPKGDPLLGRTAQG